MKPKSCKKCGQAGHNARTCGKQKVVYEPSFKRQCGKCQGFGHNARTCKGLTESGGRKTLVELGREILEKESVKAPRIEVDGTKPHRGLWLVNPDKKRCAGVIAMVRKSGEVCWKDFGGMLVDSAQSSIIGSGYKYLPDKPIGDGWVYLHLGGWESNPTMRETVIGE